MTIGGKPNQASLAKPENIKSILVVLSGGQDSVTCLFKAIHTPGIQKVGAITFLYGQTHSREVDSAAFVYELARQHVANDDNLMLDMPAYRTVKNLHHVFEGNSPLTNAGVNLEEFNSIDEMNAKSEGRIEQTFVPGRNAAFLSIAFGAAAAWGYDAIMTCVNEADRGGYPDCTENFIQAMEVAMQLATATNIRILAPLQHKDKSEIVEMARGLPGCWNALAFSHTDYAGLYPPGKNHASVLRADGFEKANYEDPLIVRAYLEGLLNGG